MVTLGLSFVDLLFRFNFSIILHACTEVSLISVGSLGCRIRPHSSTLDRYPKIRVTSGDCSRTVSLPLCIYALNHPERDDSESIEVSHLCGRSNCCFPLHLTAEPHLRNIQRKRCHRSRGIHRGRCCTHTPKCIL